MKEEKWIDERKRQNGGSMGWIRDGFQTDLIYDKQIKTISMRYIEEREVSLNNPENAVSSGEPNLEMVKNYIAHARELKRSADRLHAIQSKIKVLSIEENKSAARAAINRMKARMFEEARKLENRDLEKRQKHQRLLEQLIGKSRDKIMNERIRSQRKRIEALEEWKNRNHSSYLEGKQKSTQIDARIDSYNRQLLKSNSESRSKVIIGEAYSRSRIEDYLFSKRESLDNYKGEYCSEAWKKREEHLKEIKRLGDLEEAILRRHSQSKAYIAETEVHLRQLRKESKDSGRNGNEHSTKASTEVMLPEIRRSL